MGIDGAKHRSGAVGLRRANAVGGVKDLPLQVGDGNVIIIDDGQPANAGGRQIKQARGAQAASADHRHMRLFQLHLARPADILDHQMAGIAFDFGR